MGPDPANRIARGASVLGAVSAASAEYYMLFTETSLRQVHPQVEVTRTFLIAAVGSLAALLLPVFSSGRPAGAAARNLLLFEVVAVVSFVILPIGTQVVPLQLPAAGAALVVIGAGRDAQWPGIVGGVILGAASIFLGLLASYGAR